MFSRMFAIVRRDSSTIRARSRTRPCSTAASAVSHATADIGGGQGRSVVDAGADLADGAAEIDERVVRYLVEGDSPKRAAGAAPAFAGGDRITVRDVPTVEHTRLPGFLRGKTGVIETVYPESYVYLCDTGPDGIGPAMACYCVRFEPEELWPGNTEPGFALYADLYAAYLAPASA